MGKNKTEALEPTGKSPMDRLRDPAALREMSFSDIVGQAKDAGALLDAATAGDGYRLISSDEKKHLVGETFVITGFRPVPSSQRPGQLYTSMTIVTERPIKELGGGTRFRVNDGSTGVHAQLMDVWNAKGPLWNPETDPLPPILVQKGLRESKYTVMQDVFDDNGDPVLDEVTHRQKREPRKDPLTGAEMNATTYFLDTSE